jgi:endonuclease/exonuclease/phosphatase family metal-dependent hydrolase
MARREQTYYDKQRRRSANKGLHGSYNLLDCILFVVTVVVIAGVVLSWAARWINPATYGAMAALGLVMPLLFSANFLCLLYWVIRWKKMALAPLAVVLFFLFGVTMYFKPHFTQSYSDTSRDRSLVDVMSYNVRGMMETIDHDERNYVSSMDNIISVVDSLRPGILCLQEFQSTRNYPRQHFEDALPNLPYNIVRYNITRDEDGLGWGLAIYSRYPVARSGHFDFEGSTNSIIWADLAVNSDTVRVFNAHLQTTSISATDQEFIVNMGFVGDSTRTSKFRQMVGKLKNNSILRATQADTLALSISASPYPVIVCGDFNDTPVSYTYRRITRGLRDSFREAGIGYGYTYRGFFNLLRIDYILHSKGIESVEYSSPEFDYSDHNPVAVRLRLHKN